jgi:hypothetical protein
VGSFRPNNSIVGLSAMLQDGRSRVRIPIGLLAFFSIHLILSPSMALGLTQSLTEISIRNLPGE